MTVYRLEVAVCHIKTLKGDSGRWKELQRVVRRWQMLCGEVLEALLDRGAVEPLLHRHILRWRVLYIVNHQNAVVKEAPSGLCSHSSTDTFCGAEF